MFAASGSHVLLPAMTAFFVVLVAGIIAIAIAIVKENAPRSSVFWWYLSFWATCLALLI